MRQIELDTKRKSLTPPGFLSRSVVSYRRAHTAGNDLDRTSEHFYVTDDSTLVSEYLPRGLKGKI